MWMVQLTIHHRWAEQPGDRLHRGVGGGWIDDDCSHHHHLSPHHICILVGPPLRTTVLITYAYRDVICTVHLHAYDAVIHPHHIPE